jgi:hypothetical protein
MKTMLLRFALATALCALAAAPAGAGELRLTMANGRVTLVAHDVTIREILAEWARVGQTRIVNGEKIAGAPVTIELTDVPEAQALDAVLRSASGYVLAPRAASAPGPSIYDRIMILASSRAPAVSAAPASFNRPPPPPPQAFQATPADDDDDDVNPIPGFSPVNPGNNNPTAMPGPMPGPVVNPPRTSPATPLTSPRPGMLPQPPAQNVPAPNPYLVQPSGNVPVNAPAPGPLARPGGPGGGGH